MASVSSEATGPAAPTDAPFGRRICVQVERTVDAPMDRVWVVLRDYRAARPRMLTEHFADYAVQQEGERTVIDYRLRVGRHQRLVVAAVEEPMAGRQLREPASTVAGMGAPTFRTIIEPFRIHSVEPLRMTTSQQRKEAVVRAGYNLFEVQRSSSRSAS